MDPRRQVLGVGEVSIRQSSLPCIQFSGHSASQDFPVACLIWVDGTGRAIGEHATASTQGSYVTFVTRRPKPLTTSLQSAHSQGKSGAASFRLLGDRCHLRRPRSSLLGAEPQTKNGMEWTAEGRHRLTVHVGFLANLERKERTLLQGLPQRCPNYWR